MDKKIKLVSYAIMQVLILITSVTIIALSLKYKFSIVFPMICLMIGQLEAFLYLFSFINNKKK